MRRTLKWDEGDPGVYYSDGFYNLGDPEGERPTKFFLGSSTTRVFQSSDRVTPREACPLGRRAPTRNKLRSTLRPQV